MSDAAKAAPTATLATYFELTKPRITILLVIIAVTTYFIAAGAAWTWWGTLQTVLSVGLMSAGIFALNHLMERRQDAKMLRTRERPLPSGRLTPAAALAFGLFFVAAGLAFCWWLVGPLSAGIAAFVAVSYLMVYTPLKYKTPYHTALGAFPGATPPLAGYAAAVGMLDVHAWILFGVLFLWQFPHFLSIELIYRDDYAKADIKVLPVVDKTGFHTALQILTALGLLVPIGVLTWLTGLTGWVTALLTGVLGLGFFWFGLRAVMTKEKMAAKYLLRASVLYLPAVFILFVLRF